MPVQYPAGILAEHQHCRAAAALFDVSHMGQVRLDGADAAAALERLVPADIQGLAPGRARYTQFTNEAGGILDDLIVSNAGDHLFLVVNAGCRDADLAHLRAGAGAGDPGHRARRPRRCWRCRGRRPSTCWPRLAPGCADLPLHEHGRDGRSAASPAVSRAWATPARTASRSRSRPDDAETAGAAAAGRRRRCARPGWVRANSLRLEAGLPLYGHDIDTTTTPVEAGLAWSIGKRRREQGGFAGADAILAPAAPRAPPAGWSASGPTGGRPPARAPRSRPRRHARWARSPAAASAPPSAGRSPWAMSPTALAAPGTELVLMVRGKPLPARVVALPFVPHRYHR